MAMRIRFPGWREVDKTRTPLERLFEDLLLAKRSSGCSAKTVSWYRDNLGSYQRFLGPGERPELRDFTPGSVRRYTVHLQERRIKYEGNRLRRTVGEPLSSHTVFGHVATLKAFASWLAAEGYTDENVLRGVPQPKKRQTVINALSQDEIKKLISSVPKHTAMGTRGRAIFITFLNTGLRASELCDLQLRDVHLEEGYVKVLGKGDKERIVPIGANATRALLRYREFFRPQPVRPGIENLFLSVHGEPNDAFSAPGDGPALGGEGRDQEDQRTQAAALLRSPGAGPAPISTLRHTLNSGRGCSAPTQQIWHTCFPRRWPRCS
jgi:site-specific recombinase XerD